MFAFLAARADEYMKYWISTTNYSPFGINGGREFPDFWIHIYISFLIPLFFKSLHQRFRMEKIKSSALSISSPSTQSNPLSFQFKLKAQWVTQEEEEEKKRGKERALKKESWRKRGLGSRKSKLEEKIRLCVKEVRD